MIHNIKKLSDLLYCAGLLNAKAGNDQEMVYSERNSHSKKGGGKLGCVIG